MEGSEEESNIGSILDFFPVLSEEVYGDIIRCDPAEEKRD
jgi:hypothetical protein